MGDATVKLRGDPFQSPRKPECQCRELIANDVVCIFGVLTHLIYTLLKLPLSSELKTFP